MIESEKRGIILDPTWVLQLKILNNGARIKESYFFSVLKTVSIVTPQALHPMKELADLYCTYSYSIL